MKGKAFLNLSDNLLLIANDSGLFVLNQKTWTSLLDGYNVVNFIIKLDDNRFLTSDSIQITIWSYNIISHQEVIYVHYDSKY